MLHIQDPCWPSEEAFGGRLILSLRFRKDSGQSAEGPQLWWAQLNEGGTSIVAAGRLIAPPRNASWAAVAGSEERCPNVGMTHDGVLMLTYVTIPDGERPGGLWIAPITFKSRAGNLVPRVEASAVRRLATNCLPTPPGFSPDGRWIYAAVQEGRPGEVRLKRFAIPPGNAGPSLTEHPQRHTASG